jgi:hypothetical protein
MVARTAGSSVIDRRTATVTTSSPPTAIERISLTGIIMSATKPMATVAPERIIVWPAVSAARAADVDESSPAARPSRNLPTTSSA